MARKNGAARYGLQPITAPPGEKPDLIETFGEISPAVGATGERTEWCKATLKWWDSLEDHPTFQGLTQVQWYDLLTTAVLMDSVLKGSLKHKSELRQSLAGYLVAPADLRRASYDLTAQPQIAVVDENHPNPAFAAYLKGYAE